MSGLIRKIDKKSKPKLLNSKRVNSTKKTFNKKPSNDISTLHKSVGNKAVEGLLNSAKSSPKEKSEAKKTVTKKGVSRAKVDEKEQKKPLESEASAPKSTRLKPPIPKDASDKKEKIVKSPTNPHKDKAFKRTIRYIKKSAKNLKTHPTAEGQLAEVKDASHLDKAEQEKKNDQTAHFQSIEGSSKLSKNKKFTPEGFKKSLQKELNILGKTLPTDKDGAKEFKKNNPIDSVKENVNKNVFTEKENITGSLATDAKDKNPPKSTKPTLKAKPIPKKSIGATPKPINSKASTPKPKHKSEISMERESQSIDEYMDENKLTETQLKKSNEPEFLKALDSKTVAQKKLGEVPQTYRNRENKILGGARGEASAMGQRDLGDMLTSRKGSFEAVSSKQTASKISSQSEKQKINAEFEEIYKKTKKDVTAKLDSISAKVDKLFDSGGKVDKAKKGFEKNVEDKLDEIYSWTDFFTRNKHKSEIEEVFTTEKELFISTLDTIFDDIAKIISTGLNEAMTTIESGRKKSKEFYDSLDKKEKDLAKDSLDAFNDRYDNLEDRVSAKEQELSESLAQKYRENVNSLRETFDEIKKKASATWLDSAINAIKGVIETIKKLRQLISDLLSEIQSILPKILNDPLWFVKNLFRGVGEGIELFKKNIQKHLIGGFVKWLTGAMGSTSITIPKDIFSLKGIFSLVMQMLGLGWDYVRKKAVKLLGEPLVKAMETGVEMFKLFRSKGVAGIWEHLKEKFNDLKETIIGEIKNMLITQVIMAGIKWLVSLLIPGGGFIKAIMAIKDLIVFFVESAIMLIPTIIKAIKALASGDMKGVAKAVEEGLSRLIAVVINLFAKLIGLGGLAKKVMKIIGRVRKRIDKAIDKLILKARKKFKGLVKKGKATVKGAVKKLISWFKIKVGFKGKDGKKHSLNIEGSERKPKLVIRSEPVEFKEFVEEFLKGEDEGKKKLARDGFSAYSEWRKAVNIDIKKEQITEEKKAKKVKESMGKIRTISQGLFDNRKKELPKYKKGKNVIYQSVNAQGVGEKMDALVLSKKGKKGSTPSSPKGVYKTLFKRKKWNKVILCSRSSIKSITSPNP